VGNQKGLPIADVDNEPLVAGTIIVVGNQPRDETRDLYPGTVVTLAKCPAQPASRPSGSAAPS